MSNIELSSVASGYNLAKINENFQAIEEVLNDRVLFRQTNEPNSMDVNLDMNGYSILNTGTIDANNLTIGGASIEGYLAAAASGITPEDMTLTRYSYTVSGSSVTSVTLPASYVGDKTTLLVFRNGVQQPPEHYSFDGTVVTFSTALVSGDVVEVVYFNTVIGLTSNANSRYIQRFTCDGLALSYPINVVYATIVPDVYLNGVYQHKDTYDLVSNTIAFSEAPPEDVVCELIGVGYNALSSITSNLIDFSPSAVANASVATTLGSVGPTGSTAGNPVGWIEITVNGVKRYTPYW